MIRHRWLAMELTTKQQARPARQVDLAQEFRHDQFFFPTKESLLVEIQLEGLALLILVVGAILFLVEHL